MLQLIQIHTQIIYQKSCLMNAKKKLEIDIYSLTGIVTADIDLCDIRVLLFVELQR